MSPSSPHDPHDETALVPGEPLAAIVTALRDDAPAISAAQAAAIAARARLAAGVPAAGVPVADRRRRDRTPTGTPIHVLHDPWARRLGSVAAAALIAVVGFRLATERAAPTVAATPAAPTAIAGGTPGRGAAAASTVDDAPVRAAVRSGGDVPILAADARAVRLVLDAPEARAVHAVGDFNGWDRTGTALEREPGTGRWSVMLQLAPGRYRYAFLVDGTTWIADPRHEQVRDTDFGVPTSEVVVGTQP